jgi:RNA polymerase sigma-70 factor (ECF subfamily)
MDVSSVMEAPNPGPKEAAPATLSPGDPALRASGDVESIVLAYYEDVFRYAFRLSGNGDDAADLAQQTYLLAGRRLHQLREIARCRSWLLAIVRTCFLKSIQRRRPVLATDLDLEIRQVSSDSEATSIDREALNLALAELPESDRLILLMFYFEDLSYKEIAEQLDIPIGTVMSRLSRAKQRMRERLEARDAD